MFNMDNKRDEELVKQALTDKSAFNTLFREYHDRIYRFCCYRTGSAEASRDITAEAFYRAYKNLWQFKFGFSKFSSWLYKIASNECSNYYRKNDNKALSLDEALEARGEAGLKGNRALSLELEAHQRELDKNDEFGAVKSALDKLPALYRDAVILRYLEELSIEETASLLGKKTGTVKSLVFRGLAMIKEDVKE